MKPELFHVGNTHQSAPLSIRECLPASDADHRAMLGQLGHLARERMILHTCERFEIYALPMQTDVSAWVVPLAEWCDVSAALPAPHVRLRHGEAVAVHLPREGAVVQDVLVAGHRAEDVAAEAIRRVRDRCPVVAEDHR